MSEEIDLDIIDPDSIDYDSESLYDNNQRIFARGLSNDIYTSYMDILSFLRKKFPEAAKSHEEHEHMKKVAAIVSEGWIHMLLSQMRGEIQQEKNESEPDEYLTSMLMGMGKKPEDSH